jgi:hypothetical protein
VTSPSNYLNASQYFGEGTDANFAQYKPRETNFGNGSYDQNTGSFVAEPGTTQTLEKKQQQSTNGGCGTSFTTATDPKNINVQQSLAGHVTQISSLNDDNDTQFKILTSDGKSITMAEDGSLIFTTAKREGDPLSGRFDVRSQGSTRFLVGESLLIEVENKNDIIASKDGSKKSSKAFSLVVYGNVDITSHDGEINARAKNINLTASNELTLNAGSKISLLSGKGKGQKDSTTTSQNTQSTEAEYGGLIELKGGDLSIDSSTVRQNSSVDYKIVSHEGAHIASEKMAAYGIQSPGSFTVDVAGDMAEIIGGLKRTEIYGKSDPATSILPDQTEGWLTTIAAVKGDAFSLDSSGGGIYMHTKTGDVIMQTDSGSALFESKTSGAFSAVDKANPGGSSTSITPGVYVRGYNKGVYVGTSQGDICIGIGSAQSASTVTNGMKISAAKLEIKNTTGIYLN